MESGFGKVPVTGVVYHLLGKTGWLQVAVNGTRQMPNRNFNGDALVSFPRLSHKRQDQRRSSPKRLEPLKISKWNAQFPQGNFV